ncbi:phage integrase family protein [Vibrio diazotrophicus]|uniref:Phage integrase family protein n=1 Tax=Vibrio diazotrophicus TaxID=685 RepID=A0A329E8J9_VIBDI|nr:phage integrase family protein [Vibrio diazotrophicus]
MFLKGECLYYKRNVITKEHGPQLFPLVFMFDGTLSRELVTFFDFEFKNLRGRETTGTIEVITSVAEIYYFLKHAKDVKKYDDNPNLLVLDYVFSRTKDTSLWLDLISEVAALKRFKALRKLENVMKAVYGNKSNDIDLFNKVLYNSSQSDSHKRLLEHINIKFKTKGANTSAVTSSMNVKTRTNVSKIKTFPPEFIIDLINDESDPNQKVGYLLQAGAAFRASETSHLLINDVSYTKTSPIIIFPTVDGDTLSDKGSPISRAKVFDNVNQLNPLIPYPVNCPEWDQKKIAFLNNVHERTILPQNHLLKAGYKGVTLATSTPGIGTIIAFIDDSLEQLALDIINDQLLNQYRVRNHPFLLCDKDGFPLSKATYEKRFARSVKRFNIKLDKGPHSLRHFAGCYQANNLKVDIKVAKDFMRHSKLTSTEIYFKLDSQKIRNNLSKSEFKSSFEEIDWSKLKR